MKLLLDTHAFLWWIADDDRLSQPAEEAIGDGGNIVYLSAVSVWEIVVKAGLGRLQVPQPVDRFLVDQLQRNAFEPLSLHIRHALAVNDLPQVHRHPYDRMLIAQARADDLTLVSRDRVMHDYPVGVLW